MANDETVTKLENQGKTIESRLDARQSRREMFRGSARYLILGGLAVLSAGLVARLGGTGIMPVAPGGASAERRCPRSRCCRDCTAFSDCGLPQARSARNQSKR